MRTRGKKQAKPSPNVHTGVDSDRNRSELIAMEEAIEILKTTRPTFYRWLRSGKIKGMKVGRQWRFYRVDIEGFLRGETPQIDLPADIAPLIEQLGCEAESVGARPVGLEGLSPVQRAVRLMIVLAVRRRASDIHITSHQSGGGPVQVVLRYRVDGVLHEVARIDSRLLPAIVEEWKRAASCNIRERALPQDGRIVFDWKQWDASGENLNLDLRCCFLPAALGEAVTVRVLDQRNVQMTLDRMLGNSRDLPRIRRALGAPNGLVICTGPTGSGKTTTLYSCLNEVVRPELKVMTIEDPVEYILPWATQMAVRADAGLTFSRGLRSILRSDPDVIMLSEIRDMETMQVCIQATLTGHVVLTTLHTDDAAGALRRMADLGVDPFLIGDSVKLIIAQRLIRRLCPHCSVEWTPPAAQLDAAAGIARKGGLTWHSLERRFRRPVGCERCARTGYKGRTVIMETLEVTPEVSAALRRNAPAEELGGIAVSQGMVTMAADGMSRAAAGETSMEEAIRVLGLRVSA